MLALFKASRQHCGYRAVLPGHRLAMARSDHKRLCPTFRCFLRGWNRLNEPDQKWSNCRTELTQRASTETIAPFLNIVGVDSTFLHVTNSVFSFIFSLLAISVFSYFVVLHQVLPGSELRQGSVREWAPQKCSSEHLGPGGADLHLIAFHIHLALPSPSLCNNRFGSLSSRACCSAWLSQSFYVPKVPG